MSHNVFLIALIGTLAAPLACHAEACHDKSPGKQVKQKTRDLIQALGGYTAAQKDEAISKTKTALDHLDKRVDALETRVDENWDKMNKKTRGKARASLKTLRQKRIQVAEKYGSLKEASDDAWGHLMKGFTDAYKDLGKAWEKSINELGAGNGRKK